MSVRTEGSEHPISPWTLLSLHSSWRKICKSPEVQTLTHVAKVPRLRTWRTRPWVTDWPVSTDLIWPVSYCLAVDRRPASSVARGVLFVAYRCRCGRITTVHVRKEVAYDCTMISRLEQTSEDVSRDFLLLFRIALRCRIWCNRIRPSCRCQLRCSWLLGAVAKLRLLASSCLSVCLSAWNSSAPTGRIIMKFEFESFSKIEFH